MTIYFLNLIWAILSEFLLNFTNFSRRNKDKIYLLINFLPMMIMSGLRKAGVGSDSGMYYGLFMGMTDDSFSSRIEDVEYLIDITGKDNLPEAGFYLFAALIHMVSENGQVFFFLYSVVVLTGFAWFFYKNSSSMWISTVFFIGMGFFVETFNTMRQCMGIMVMCVAYTVLQSNRSIISKCLAIFATRFHNSLLVMLPFFFFGKLTKKKTIIIIMMGLFLTLALYVIGQNLAFFLGDIKYILYLANINQPRNLLHLFKIIFFVPFIIYGIKYCEGRDSNKIYFSSICVAASCCITFLQCFELLIFQRLFMTYAIFICILAPWVLLDCSRNMLQDKNIILFSIVWMVIFLVLYVHLYGYLHNTFANFEYQLYN